MKYSPVANALKLIGGKWKIMILDSLLSKHMRFGELKRSLKIGVNCLHGPHHGAQKSTMTGIVFDFSTTSLRN